jgi:hypothetical protein
VNPLLEELKDAPELATPVSDPDCSRAAYTEDCGLLNAATGSSKYGVECLVTGE